MKIDYFTRLVLTVIALCLVWMCVRDIGSVHAAGEVVDVRIVGIDKGTSERWETLPVEGVRGGEAIEVHSDPTAPLRVKNDPSDALWIRGR